MTIPTHALNDGHDIPAIGFGTYPLKGDEAHQAVTSALDNGYRLLDTAVNYGNEEEVGRAATDWLKANGVDRSELTIQTKLPGRHHDYRLAIDAVQDSLTKLQVQRIDVLLIHWPNPITNKYRDAWRALVDLQSSGVVRTIGVSNFTAEHLTDVVELTGVTPAINQIELHPHFTQTAMRAEHAERGILTQSWSPLGKREAPFEHAAVADTASQLGVTPAQVILRWQIQLGNVPLPKSATPARQAANLDVFGFELSDEQMSAISALDREDGRLFDGDPNTHEEM